MGGIIGSVAQVAIPAAAAVFGGPAAAAFMGTSAAVGSAAAGALAGGLTSAATGGNVLAGAAMGGLGGYGMGGGFSSVPVLSTPSEIMAAAPGIDASTAAALSNGGLSAEQASIMVANGATTADMATVAQAYQSGSAPLLSSLSQGAQSFLTSPNGSRLMGSLVSGGAALYGASQTSDAALKAAQLSAQQSQNALNQQQQQFNIGQANQKPWMGAGQTALGAQLDLMGLPGGTTGSATNQLAQLQQSPGYQFQLQQGQQGLDASAAARGGMGSGKNAVAASDYNQNYASTAYGNRLNQLANLSTTGQNAASGMASQGMNYAGNVGNIMQNMGNTQGNALMTAANANQSGILGAAQAASNYFNPMPQNQSTLVR
jgi:hypothetical protein